MSVLTRDKMVGSHHQVTWDRILRPPKMESFFAFLHIWLFFQVSICRHFGRFINVEVFNDLCLMSDQNYLGTMSPGSNLG